MHNIHIFNLDKKQVEELKEILLKQFKPSNPDISIVAVEDKQPNHYVDTITTNEVKKASITHPNYGGC